MKSRKPLTEGMLLSLQAFRQNGYGYEQLGEVCGRSGRQVRRLFLEHGWDTAADDQRAACPLCGRQEEITNENKFQLCPGHRTAWERAGTLRLTELNLILTAAGHPALDQRHCLTCGTAATERRIVPGLLGVGQEKDPVIWTAAERINRGVWDLGTALRASGVSRVTLYRRLKRQGWHLEPYDSDCPICEEGASGKHCGRHQMAVNVLKKYCGIYQLLATVEHCGNCG